MKNTSLFRRILSVALVIALLGSFLVPVASAEPAGASQTEELTLTPIAPGELGSLKLGQEAEKEESIEKEDHALTDVVRVSIALDRPSTLAAGFSPNGIANNPLARIYRASLRADQAAMTAKIEKAIGGKLDVQWNLTLAANFISANVQYGQIETIKGVEGVKNVFLENRYEPQVDEKVDEPNNGAATYMTGANLTWAAGYTGAGSRLAIIDTGIDKDHQSFSGEALEYAFAQTAEELGMTYDDYVASLNLLTADKIDAVKGQLNANIGSGANVNISTKIPYGYCYVDRDFDVTHVNDSQGEHGSHVEGITAANRFIKVDGEFKPAIEAVGTLGVAPDAQIVTMKVFGNGGGAYSSDYMVAIEDAIVLGCDSANLSLGSSAPGFGFSDDYESVMNELVENGMVCTISMGNSGMWYDTPKNLQYPYLYIDDASFHTGGSPGSYTNSLAIASVDNAGKVGTPLYYGDRTVFYNETSGYGNEPISTLAGKEYEYVLLDGAGVDDNDHVGQEGDDFLALGKNVLEGKVAMCYRGTSSFFAKANAAVAQGAVAVVIINNQPGTINMNLTGYEYTAPAVSITQADGDAIKENSEEVTDEEGNVLYYTGTMSAAESIEVLVPENTDTVTVSSFSSYGVPGTLVMKPEILAPGGSIWSVYGQTPDGGGHDQYEMMSGTSMAAPQVNGMAGILAQYIRENDLCEKTGLTQRQLINSLLMSTAHPVYDSNGNYWPVIRVGAGLANVADAIAAQSYILMDENASLFPDTAKDGKVKAELGDDPDHTGAYDYSFTVYPYEGSKEFTLRTDIFTQGIAGNGGYGMLQDTGTMLIGANTTYEINGETYQNTYHVDADVNMDGETNAADAQAILDRITGAEEEGAPFDEDVADLDGDGEITSYDAKLLLDSAESPIIEITEATKVNVHIELDSEDKEALLGYFTKGFYVQGYTYVEPVADEEGAMDVVHSIPILGYCGSWTDPSMFDRTSVIDDAYGTGKLPYVANNNKINYLTMKDANGASAIYMGNPYTVEETFPADRLAMNSNDTIASYTYLNIRNLATLGFAVQDESGKVLFAQSNPTWKNGAYYYVNGGTWQNYGTANYTVGKKLSAAGLKEGDKATVGFYALPEYYGQVYAAMNGKVAEIGSLSLDGFKAVLEAGIVGDGAAIKYDVTIDNTAPTVKGAYRDLITGDITLMAQDNAYIAYVAVTNKAGTKEFVGMVPEQSEPGEELEIPLDLNGQSLPSTVCLLVGDYAGNEVAFQVQLGGEQEDNGGLTIGFVNESTTAAPGAGNRAWEINRDTLYYNHSTGTYDGLGVFSQLNFGVLAAEYVKGYVFMAGDDGWFYAAELNALDEAARVGRYADVINTVRDMAYNTRNSTLYVLDDTNNLYTMDLVTGKLTNVVSIVLDGASGINAAANKLAIDDNGNFYVGGYGNSTYSALYTFTLPEAVEEETPDNGRETVYAFGFETNVEEEGWTFVDQDADGNNWALAADAQEGSWSIFSASYAGGASLTPDNWAISPAIDLSKGTAPVVSIYAKLYLSSYPETLAFFAGTSADPAEMEQVGEDFIPSGSWTQYTADLSAFEGEDTVYVAIRHYNSADQFRVYVDSFEVTAEPAADEEEPVDAPAVKITATKVGSMGIYNFSYGGAFAWDHDEDKLYAASNYNNTQDYDHYLWIVDTETGKATRANTVDGAAGTSARLYGCVNGLFIVPSNGGFETTEEPTAIIAEPEELDLLKGQKREIIVTVLPWTLENKEFTFVSNDPSIATVNEKGTVTGVASGETTITVSTVAEPVLTTDVTVVVTEAPATELRGFLWDNAGYGQAVVFNTNAPQDWESAAQVGNFRWGAFVDDRIYTSTDSTMYVVDADTYEMTELGGIVPMWIPSDAAVLPTDLPVAWGLGDGFTMCGLCNGGTYFEILNPEGGQLNYWDLSSVYESDPMATLAYIGRTDYDTGEDVYENCAEYLMMTESGKLWFLFLTDEGTMIREEYQPTGLDLSGVSDVTNETWASMIYSAENGFLYVTLYNGADDFAHLYAIDAEDPSVNAEVGDFNENVWPVVGLYQYDPATDLILKVDPTDVTIFEGQTADVHIKVKLGETNEYTAEVADPSIASFEDGVVTGLKEGETTITITTVDSNAEGKQLTETVNVKVKGYKSIEAFVKAQVTNDKGARFTKISLDGAVVSQKGVEAPGNVTSGGRGGNLYLAGVGTTPYVLDAETYEPTDEWNGVDTEVYGTYPAMDIANYPELITEEGVVNSGKFLFTTNLGWLVTPDYYGWNLSSYLPDMAGICFAGSEYEYDDEWNVSAVKYVYYLITTSGVLYEVDVDVAEGSLSLNPMIETGLTFADANDVSMVFLSDADLHGDWEIDLGAQGLVIADNGSKNLYFLDFMAEDLEDVVNLIGVVDAENVSGLVGSFDDLGEIVLGEPEPEPEPELDPYYVGDERASFDFETDPEDDGITFVDADGDDFNWFWNLGNEGYAEISGHGESAGMLMSNSYDNDYGVLTPDNWVVFPAVDLTDAEDDVMATFFAKGQDADWASEVFAIYAGTTSNPDEMTKIGDDFTATGTWKQYQAALSDFIGESEVYVAIRHYNVSDMYMLDVDDYAVLENVELVEPEAPESNGYRAVPMAYKARTIGDGVANYGFVEAPASIQMTKLGESANAAFGSTNAIKGELKRIALRAPKDETTVADGNVNIVLSDDVETTNGKFIVTYDPTALTFESFVGNLPHISVNADVIEPVLDRDGEEEPATALGVITVAYASATEIPAEDVIASLYFTYDKEAGVDTVVKVEAMERNDELALDEEPLEIPVKADPAVHEHVYGEPVWTWAEDLSSATATFTCECGDVQTVEDNEIDEEVTTEPLPHVAGVKTLTASVEFNGKTYTDTKDVEIEALPCPCENFVDMPEVGTPEHEAIDWAYTHTPYQITAGMDETHFGTDLIVTRAQAMTFLWASMDKPEPETQDSPFTDVKNGKWYCKPILWAVENGITVGTGNNKFSPNKTCTHAEMLQFLYACFGKPEPTIENPYTNLGKKWYKQAAIWAYEMGIEQGENGEFDANAPCTRATTVLYIYRALTGQPLPEIPEE